MRCIKCGFPFTPLGDTKLCAECRGVRQMTIPDIGSAGADEGDAMNSALKKFDEARGTRERDAKADKLMATFDTGATRSSEDGKIDPEGFLSPLVIEEYCHYMHACRIQDDGQLRASDNWQQGMPKPRYMRSIWRHFLTMWSAWRRDDERTVLVEIMALLFNLMGFAHVLLTERRAGAAHLKVSYEELRHDELRERKNAIVTKSSARMGPISCNDVVQ